MAAALPYAITLAARIQTFNTPKEKFIHFKYKHKTNPVEASLVVRVEMKTAWTVKFDNDSFRAWDLLSWREKQTAKPAGGWVIDKEFRYVLVSKVDSIITGVKKEESEDMFNEDVGTFTVIEPYVFADSVEMWPHPIGKYRPHVLKIHPDQADGKDECQSFRSGETTRISVCSNDDGKIILRATVIIDPKTQRVTTHIPFIDDWDLDIRYINYD